MNGRQKHYRYAAALLFVLMFLNAGGLVCLGHCFSAFKAHAAEHSSRSMPSEHCRRMAMPETVNADPARPGVDSRRSACCMIPVGMVSVPTEKRFSQTAIAEPPPRQLKTGFLLPFGEGLAASSGPVYRPPPLNGNTLRSLNCVIRI